MRDARFHESFDVQYCDDNGQIHLAEIEDSIDSDARKGPTITILIHSLLIFNKNVIKPKDKDINND